MKYSELRAYWSGLIAKKGTDASWKAEVREMPSGTIDFIYGDVLLASLKPESDHVYVFQLLPIGDIDTHRTFRFHNTDPFATATAVLPDLLDSLLPSMDAFRMTQNLIGKRK